MTSVEWNKSKKKIAGKLLGGRGWDEFPNLS